MTKMHHPDKLRMIQTFSAVDCENGIVKMADGVRQRTGNPTDIARPYSSHMSV